MRLLSALEQGTPRRRTSSTSSTTKGLLALATLSIAGAAALVVATYSDSSGAPDVVAMGTAPDSTFTTLAPPAGAASGPMESTGSAATAAATRPVAVPPQKPLEGPARVESGNEGLAALPGMAATADAVAAQRAAASTPTPTSAATSASAPRGAKSRSATASRTAAVARARARPETVADATARDPDADLVAAIMARLESPRPANGRPTPRAANVSASTIASLVRDCNAMADSVSALACRRRICDGYWGQAQACPKSMAPATTSAGTASVAH
jgi:hypothetical protein